MDFDKLIEAVQKVGFPIVMVFILTYVIYKQNDTLTKVNSQQAANMTAFTTRMDALGKDIDDLKRNCGVPAPAPAH